MKTNSLKLLRNIASYSVLKITRKENVYEKENIYFKWFWPKAHNVFMAGFFSIATFSEQLLPTACEYWMLLPLT